MKFNFVVSAGGSIPYHRELNQISGGVVGSLLFKQLDYWFDRYPNGFYKFMAPCKHPFYKRGDSWSEELCISIDEFRAAFDKIGVRYKSKKEFDQAKAGGDVFGGRFFCSYVSKLDNLTYYLRNHKLVDSELLRLFTKADEKPTEEVDANSDVTSCSKGRSEKPTSEDLKSPPPDRWKYHLPKWENPIPRNGKIPTPYTDTNPKINSETTTATTTACADNSARQLKGSSKSLAYRKLYKNLGELDWEGFDEDEQTFLDEIFMVVDNLVLRQMIIDELVGAKSTGSISSFKGYATAVVKKAVAGEFQLDRGVSVAKARSKREGAVLARANFMVQANKRELTPELLKAVTAKFPGIAPLLPQNLGVQPNG